MESKWRSCEIAAKTLVSFTLVYSQHSNILIYLLFFFVDFVKSSAIPLIISSSCIVILTFLGFCGVLKENRFLLFLHFVLLLATFVVIIIGGAVAAFQNFDVIKGQNPMSSYFTFPLFHFP